MKNKKRNLISIDLSDCKKLNECMKVIKLITSERIKITVIPLSTNDGRP